MQFIRWRFPASPDKVLLIVFPKFYAFGGRTVRAKVKASYTLCGPHCRKLPGTVKETQGNQGQVSENDFEQTLLMKKNRLTVP